LQAHLTRSGLREKVSKRAVYSRTPDSLERFRWPQDAFQVHTISHVGIILVGTPLALGADEAAQAFVDLYLDGKTKRHFNALEGLRDLGNLQVETLLLRYCPEGALTHWQRTMRPEQLQERAGRFGARLLREVARLAGRKELSDAARSRASLRISKAGLGLSDQVRKCSGAFLSGWHAALRDFAGRFPRLLKARDAVLGQGRGSLRQSLQRAWEGTVGRLPEEKRSKFPTVETLGGEAYGRKIQQHLAKALADQDAQRVFEGLGSKADQAKFLSFCGPGAAAVLAAIPSEAGLKISNQDMRMVIQERLGVQWDVDAAWEGELCDCRGEHPALGAHYEVCGLERAKFLVHDPACELLRECGRSTGLYIPAKEPRGLPGAGQGGGDLLVRGGGAEMADAIWDLTFPTVACASMLPQAAEKELFAAQTAEQAKCVKHGPAAAANSLDFVPVVIEATGAWGKRAQGLLNQLARRVDDVAPDRATWAAPTFSQYWLQRMGVHLQRARMQGIRRIADRVRRNRERTWFAGGAGDWGGGG